MQDTTSFKFGSIAWQEAMKSNIKEKRAREETLDPYEEVFEDLQAEHEERIIEKALKVDAPPVRKLARWSLDDDYLDVLSWEDGHLIESQIEERGLSKIGRDIVYLEAY